MKTTKLITALSLVLSLFIVPAKAQLQVTTSGSVGIAQTSPSQKLDINGSAIIESTNRLYFNGTNKYVGTPTGVDFGLVNKDGTLLRIGSTGSISFYGATSGESGTANQASINGYGVGISPTGGAAAWSGVNLYVSGSGWVTGTWSVGSDKRFKKNINHIDGALDKVLKLNGRIYEFNKEQFKDYNLPDGKTFGFIAQELKEVLPEAVSIDNKGYYGINYLAVIPVLAEAIKEQNKKITDLESQLSYCCTNKQQSNATGINSGNGSTQTNNTTPQLFQNNPNPFNQQTTIGYYLPTETKSASVMIFDMQGKLVKTITVTTFGNASLTINANELSAGMFLYSLVADGKEVDSKRMILTQ